MNKSAVSQAKQRLIKLEKSLAGLRAAGTTEEAEEAWTDFLVAASTIYSKLEQGAKGYRITEPWFGRKKKERKDDQLLRYLHFARNSAEHGIERVTATSPPNWHHDGRPLRFNERVPIKFQVTANPGTGTPSGEILDGIIAGPTLKPVRAHDKRYGDFCDPPTQHMGKEITFSDFVDMIGEAAIPYLTAMIDEAETLVEDDSNHIAK
jgi:hypothetical protein